MTLRRLFPLLATLFLGATLRGDDLSTQVATVERIRHLSFTQPVASESVARTQLPASMRAQLAASMPYSEEQYTTVLRALQLVDGNATNVMGQLLELLQGQVLAYYDPSTRVFYVVDTPPPSMPEGLPGGDVMRDAVVVHELTHALQDQRFGVGRLERELRDDWDRSLALHAVAEGEASFVMLAYVLEQSGISMDALVQTDMASSAMAAMTTASASIGGDAPKYFVDSLAYPYIRGMLFVLAAYKRGGWPAVDALWSSPPQSTREVSNPDEYFKRVAPQAATFVSPTPRRGLLTTEHLGQFHWSFLLGGDASRGWVDDRVTVLENEFCEPTVLARTEWQTDADAARFRDAYAAFLKSRGIAAELRRDGRQVFAAYGADLGAVENFVWSETAR